MTKNPVKPGDEVWTMGYMNSVKKQKVVDVKSDGIKVKDRLYVIPFNELFDTPEDAIDGIIERGKSEFYRAQKLADQAASRLKRLLKKYGR